MLKLNFSETQKANTKLIEFAVLSELVALEAQLVVGFRGGATQGIVGVWQEVNGETQPAVHGGKIETDEGRYLSHGPGQLSRVRTAVIRLARRKIVVVGEVGVVPKREIEHGRHKSDNKKTIDILQHLCNYNLKH